MIMRAHYAETYHPRRVLNHPEFRILGKSEIPSRCSNIGVFYNHKREIHLVQRPYIKPGPGQVCVHVRATGICWSDVLFWKYGRIGNSMVLTTECGSGHESAGEVFEVGDGVTQWKAGDRVAIEAGLPCSSLSCEHCRIGHYNACPDMVFFSTPPFHGTLCRWHLHPAELLHRLPENVSFEEGALCEPLAVVLAAIDRSGLRIGHSTLICGAGFMGLICMLVARAAGAEPIVITDVVQSRLDFAKRSYPNVRTVLVECGQTPQELAVRIRRIAEGPVKVALECTGVQSSLHTAIYSTQFGGKVFVMGISRDEQTFPFVYLSENEINVSFQYRYANQYPKAIRLVSAGVIDLKPLITHRFRLEDAIVAFHVAADPTLDTIKVQVVDS